jgi:hypothetical protein
MHYVKLHDLDAQRLLLKLDIYSITLVNHINGFITPLILYKINPSPHQKRAWIADRSDAVHAQILVNHMPLMTIVERGGQLRNHILHERFTVRNTQRIKPPVIPTLLLSAVLSFVLLIVLFVGVPFVVGVPFDPCVFFRVPFVAVPLRGSVTSVFSAVAAILL